jgi:NAD(P)-dependent dehydrogenase (short-subunit alcohol dehydrogenase family)
VKLQNQTVIVTGASRGIGRVIAERCAAEGARVALAARSEHALQETAQRIRKQGGEAFVVPTDVTDYESVRRLASTTQEQLGPVDVLVNGAGRLAAIGPSWEADPANWWSDVTVNLLGVFHLCRAVLPGMRERGSGRVINIVGGGTRGPFPFASGYACSKAAAMRFTETLAHELAETHSGIKVFALSPGFVRTRMTEQFADTEAGRKWMGRLAERLEANEDDPPARAAEMVVVLATGALDELHGRYLHSSHDLERLESLRGRAPDIAEEDARTLRMQ